MFVVVALSDTTLGEPGVLHHFSHPVHMTKDPMEAIEFAERLFEHGHRMCGINKGTAVYALPKRGAVDESGKSLDPAAVVHFGYEFPAGVVVRWRDQALQTAYEKYLEGSNGQSGPAIVPPTRVSN